jgi:hypothetical protein
MLNAFGAGEREQQRRISTMSKRIRNARVAGISGHRYSQPIREEIVMSNNPRESQNIGSMEPAASEEKDQAEEQEEGEGSSQHGPHGDSDPSIKNH